MSDSGELGVTHMEISSPFEDLSDIGSPGVVGPEHEGLPWMLDDPYVQVALQAPPSPDYIPGPQREQSTTLPVFAHRAAVIPEYMPQVRYLRRTPESSEDDDVDIEADNDEEEEEHPAPADSAVVALPSCP
ncbi:hypothetical protein Tco_0604853 [Tanacetum coccineum]